MKTRILLYQGSLIKSIYVYLVNDLNYNSLIKEGKENAFVSSKNWLMTAMLILLFQLTCLARFLSNGIQYHLLQKSSYPISEKTTT